MRAEASHVAKLRKLIEETSRRHNTWQVFQDFVAMSAISIRNAVDFRDRDTYEEQYLAIVKRYEREEIDVLATWLVEIPVAEATLADIYFMAWGREPQHVSIITDKGIIHSYSGVGKVVEHALDESWQRRIVAAYRYPVFSEGE